VPVGDVDTYEAELYRYLDLRQPGILSGLAEKKQIDDALRGQITAALKDFGQQFAARKAA
jgi:F-type H+-transporting ATPase subunit alpha